MKTMTPMIAAEASVEISAPRDSRNGSYGMSRGSLDHSGLMPADLITLPHFSVSSMISFSKSAGEPDNAEPPIVGSASAVLISFRLTKENPQGRGRSRGL